MDKIVKKFSSSEEKQRFFSAFGFFQSEVGSSESFELFKTREGEGTIFVSLDSIQISNILNAPVENILRLQENFNVSILNHVEAINYLLDSAVPFIDTETIFDPDKKTIYAAKPGLVIGRSGKNIKKLARVFDSPIKVLSLQNESEGILRVQSMVDGPTIEQENGTKRWFVNGKLHREDGPAVEEPDGTKEWYINGKRHREDGPAVEKPDGTKKWYINGKLHKENGPAIEEPDGTKEWWINGKYHREDGPAMELSDGTKKWYFNDKLHREDGPAIELPNGTKKWYVNGQLHRENGPAVERADGTKEWYINGRLHREDGPAIEEPDGTKEWWVNDFKLTEEQFFTRYIAPIFKQKARILMEGLRKNIQQTKTSEKNYI